MFLFKKYRPIRANDFFYNRDILEQLIYLATNEDVPHVIISGPPGSGKKTLTKFFLESLYDKGVNNLSKIKYNITGSSVKKEIEIMQSNYHIIIEPTSTNNDRHILQEIIKQYAMHVPFNIFMTNRKFKTIVIYNIENLANNSQAALRRTMELYAKTCRFVMVCNNLSKILKPLRSRCKTFCVPVPTIAHIDRVITYISIMERIVLTDSEKKWILDNCNNDVKRAIWMIDSVRLGTPKTLALDQSFEKLVDLIFLGSCETKDLITMFDDEIRHNIYNILINNIKGTTVITTLLDLILQRIDDNDIAMKIIEHASNAEYNLVHGRRDIIDIDYFVMGAIKELANRPIDKKPKLKTNGELHEPN